MGFVGVFGGACTRREWHCFSDFVCSTKVCRHCKALSRFDLPVLSVCSDVNILGSMPLLLMMFLN